MTTIIAPTPAKTIQDVARDALALMREHGRLQLTNPATLGQGRYCPWQAIMATVPTFPGYRRDRALADATAAAVCEAAGVSVVGENPAQSLQDWSEERLGGPVSDEMVFASFEAVAGGDIL